MKRVIVGVIIGFALETLSIHAQIGQGNLNTAMQFEREARFDDALRQYERLIDADVDAEVKLEAKFRAGRIYLDEKSNPAKAQPFFEDVAKAVKYPNLAAFAVLYGGKSLLATAATDADLNRALSEFDSVILTWPGTPVEVEARMAAGHILERQHKFERAIINYQAVVFGFPDSSHAPMAFIRLGHSLARLGRIVDA